LTKTALCGPDAVEKKISGIDLIRGQVQTLPAPDPELNSAAYRIDVFSRTIPGGAILCVPEFFYFGLTS
jgi:hypothetical protein